MNAPRKPEIVGWFRKLDGDRLEIFLKVERVPDARDRKIRASGPEEEIYELVEWFEEKTGMRVEHPTWRRVRKGRRPIEGQMELVIGELPSADSDRVSSDATATG